MQTNEPRQETQIKSKIKKKKTAIEQLKEKARRQQKRNIKTKLPPVPKTPSTIELQIRKKRRRWYGTTPKPQRQNKKPTCPRNETQYKHPKWKYDDEEKETE